MLNIIGYEKNANSATMKQTDSTTYLPKIKFKNLIIPNGDKVRKLLELLHTVRNVNWHSHFGKRSQSYL